MNYVLELQSLMVKDNYLIAVRDNFENLMTKSVLKITESKIKEEDVEVRLKNRVFSVIVECVQNICQTEEVSGSNDKDSVLIMNKIDDGYQVCAGNRIDEEKKNWLEEFLRELEGSTDDQLKQLKLSIIKRKEKLDDKQQVALTFIELYSRSKGRVEFTFESDGNGQFFFMIQIDITAE